MATSIAVIEDDINTLLALRHILEDEGYGVVAISFTGGGAPPLLNGKAAPDPTTMGRRMVEKIITRSDPAGREDVDLFLIDMMLPGTSGADLAEELRRGRFMRTPMVAMSASQRMCELARSSALFDDVLSKPFHLDDLLACIAKHSGKPTPRAPVPIERARAATA